MSEGSAPDTQTGVSGLGIAALVLGLLSLMVAIFMPCIGIFMVVPVGGIGALLGLIAVATAASGKKTGIGIPVAGTIVCIVAIAISVYWWVAAGSALSGAVKKEYDDAVQSAKAGTSVTVADLLKDYKEDEKKADEKYKGKWLKVKGKVGEALPLLGVTMPSDDKDAGAVRVQPVLAEVEKFSKMTGKEVTLGGKCDGKIGTNVTLTSGVVLD